jgi:hypothetical protein
VVLGVEECAIGNGVGALGVRTTDAVFANGVFKDGAIGGAEGGHHEVAGCAGGGSAGEDDC